MKYKFLKMMSLVKLELSKKMAKYGLLVKILQKF